MTLQHRPFSDPADTLVKAMPAVDEETGIIRLVYEAPAPPDAPRIFGYGSLCGDLSYLGYLPEGSLSGSTAIARDQAIAGAIGEAIERYSAAYLPDDELIIRPYRSVADQAISPWALTLYGEEQYQRADFPYNRLSGSDSIGWVEGYSLFRDKAVLVPAFAVYMPYQYVTPERATVQQTTSGLACGNTLEEAILSAISEVIERDAAMLMWLQTRRPPKVIVSHDDISSSAAAALRSFGLNTQYVVILDVTTDLGIPTYIAVFNGTLGNGRSGAVFCSSAHLSPRKAITGALTELAQTMMWVSSLLERVDLSDTTTTEVSTIEDHVLWPTRPDRRAAFEFALSSERSVNINAYAEDNCSDVLTAIEKYVDLIGRQGIEVIVVDVTSPDIRELGFYVVRAILPGTQPLFFGDGFHRLSERARWNQYTERMDHRINLHPHPFP